MTDRVATGVGYAVMYLGAALLVLVMVLGLIELIGMWQWKNLRRIYNLTVLAYWLQRLEKGGVRVFQKAEEEDRDTMRQKIATHRGERDRARAAAALDAGRMDGEKG